MESLEFTRVLEQFQCVGVRIEVKKNLPVTVNKEYLSGRKHLTVNLVDLINAEDLTVLLARIDELSVIGSGSLRVNCRFVPDNKRYLICCSMQREKRFKKNADHLFGSIMDVFEFYENLESDPAQLELTKMAANKFSPSTAESGNIDIVEIIGKKQLCDMQLPLSGNRGLHSAILTEGGKFICSGDSSKTNFNADDYQHSRKLYVKVNHVIYAVWTIASDDNSLIERHSAIHDVLCENLSKLTSSYIMLYNEMVNTEQANKLLSETIEQQMLLNGIYGKLLNERNSLSTMQSIVDLTGEFLKLERILVCEEHETDKKHKIVYEWVFKDIITSKVFEFNNADYPVLISELESYETYFSNNPDHDVLGLKFSSYVASNLNGDGSKYGMIIYIVNDEERVLSHAEKRLLRSISQIVAAIIMRCKDNEALDESNERLQKLAFHDQVLGVKNKTSLSYDISVVLAAASTGAVIAFKIPNLKNIENFVGLGSTDELAKEALECIRNYENLSAEPYRFSDDVFMVLLRSADTNAAKDFCDALVERFSKPWTLDGAEHYLEIIAGVAMYPQAGSTPEELCRVAIMSMNKAVEYGVNQYAFFSGDFEHPEIDVYHCARILKKSVENNMEGLTVKYIPVYSRQNELVSAEAVLLLHDEVFPPHIIMKIAEKMGIDVIVNTWVMQKACEFTKKIRESNKDFKISINATSRSLTANIIVTLVRNALTQTELTPQALTIQFTERVVAMNYDRFLAILSELKKMGVSVVLDNVGSYYTATSLMRHSGISAAKADMTIFTSMVDEFSKVYTDNLMKLAKDNSVCIGVKGIDSPEQLDLIPGVDWFQSTGARAMDEEEFLELR